MPESSYEVGRWTACHRVLGSAIRALPEGLRPQASFHLGGPPPRLDPEGLVRLALWISSWASSVAMVGEREAIDACLAEIEVTLRDWPNGVAHEPRLRDLGFGARREGMARVAQMACACAANAVLRHSDRAGDSLVAMARRVVVAVEEPQRFLSELDHQLMGLEAGRLVRRYSKDPALRVQQIRYRADGGNGSAGVLVVELTDGTFGGIAKLRSRYRWFSGDKDTVVAHLPDAHFAAAARMS